jgi:asparagine N-glycosylation enzyme membrane subunit Stt3
MPNIVYSQHFIITSLVFVMAASGFAGLSIKDRRPRTSLNPSMIPTIPLLLISGTISLFALIHLVSLFKPGAY